MNLLALAGAAVLGILAKTLWDKRSSNKLPTGILAPLPGANASKMLTSLAPNQVIAADILVDSSSLPTNDPQNNAQPIADALAGVGLVSAGGPPAPRDATQSAAFTSKQPSRWAYNVRWTGPAAMPGAMPGFVMGINFYPTGGN